MVTGHRPPTFLVATDRGVLSGDEIHLAMLSHAYLFKTLSLIVCGRLGIPTPSTLLLLSPNWEVVNTVAAQWGLPLMVRMDYSSLRGNKPLGGIGLSSLPTILEVSKFLFARKFLPMFHPHLSRFDDEYSAGVLLELGSDLAEIELVGKAFDASDLRLGKSVPHERITLNLATGRRISRSTIDHATYERERRSRGIRRNAYLEYEKYANAKGRLATSLAQFQDQDLKLPVDIPTVYEPIPSRALGQLGDLSSAIHELALKRLPASAKFVASLSLLPKTGWTLWDIYGGWYKR